MRLGKAVGEQLRQTAREFSPEDRYRVSRLTEEIQGRLEELAEIGARVSGIRLTPDMVRKYAPQETKVRSPGLCRNHMLARGALRLHRRLWRRARLVGTELWRHGLAICPT
jgi:hypothetical protein